MNRSLACLEDRTSAIQVLAGNVLMSERFQGRPSHLGLRLREGFPYNWMGLAACVRLTGLQADPAGPAIPPCLLPEPAEENRIGSSPRQ